MNKSNCKVIMGSLCTYAMHGKTTLRASRLALVLLLIGRKSGVTEFFLLVVPAKPIELLFDVPKMKTAQC